MRMTPLPPTSLRALRVRAGLTLVQAAAALELGADVWHKFEVGTIEPDSLTEAQRKRFADFFQIDVTQFIQLLSSSRAQAPTLCRPSRSTRQVPWRAASRQSFAEALEKSAMSPQAKWRWQRGTLL